MTYQSKYELYLSSNLLWPVWRKKLEMAWFDEKSIFLYFQGLPKNAISFTELFLFFNPNFSLSSKLSLDTKTSKCFITENTKENLFNWKYYLTKGILQFTVFFDHPVEGICGKNRGHFVKFILDLPSSESWSFASLSHGLLHFTLLQCT